MPSPFLRMNAYLENPQLWPEVHSRLIIAIADAIAPQLPVPSLGEVNAAWVYELLKKQGLR